MRQEQANANVSPNSSAIRLWFCEWQREADPRQEFEQGIVIAKVAKVAKEQVRVSTFI